MESNSLLNSKTKLKSKAVTESTPTCVVCHGAEVKTLCDIDGYAVLTCHSCATDFIWPMPDQQSLKELYDRREWFEGGERGGYEHYDDQTESLPQYLEEAFGVIEAGGTPKMVLDIGCGYGTHLAVAAEKGWQCFGVEVSEHARKMAKERHSDSIYLVERVEELVPYQFDLILLLDVIEHLADPYQLFYALFSKGSVGPQTRIVITTPNARSSEAVADPSKWAYRHPPSHLVYYSAQSLYTLLSQLKWNAVKIAGLYPLNGCPMKSDKEAPALNEKLKGYTGLLCTATGSDFSEFMHERYVPGTWAKITEYEHIPRYVMAQKLAEGLKVLDFGCGTGYGSAMLAKVAESVVGVDISEEALQWARHHHRNSRLRFERRDDLGAGLPDSSFDLITCFEMIEHVSQDVQRQCLTQFRRLLKRNGILIISTPNPNVTSLYGENPFHIHEMSRDEFEGFLKAGFKSVTILEQKIHPIITINGNKGKRSKKLVVGDSEEAAYIGIASDTLLSSIQGLEYLDQSFDFIGEWLYQSNSLNKARLGDYNHFMANKQQEANIAELRESLIEKEESFNQQEANIAELREALIEKEKSFNQQEANIAELRESLSDKEEGFNQQEANIAELREALIEKEKSFNQQEANIAELRKSLIEKEESFNQQEANIAELREALIEKEKSFNQQEANIAELREALSDKEEGFNQQEDRVRDLSISLEEANAFRQALEANVTQLHNELRLRDDMIWQFRSSRMLRFAHTLRHDPIGVKKTLKLVYLSGAMVCPEFLKIKLSPVISWLRSPKIARQEIPVVSKKKPRVLHVIANFMLGGSSRLVCDIIENLDGFHHEVISSFVPEPPAYPTVVVHSFPRNFAPENLKAFLNQYDPDIVHIHYWGDCDFSWYDAVFLLIREHNCLVVQNINTPVEPYVDNRIDRYVYVSDYVKQLFGEDNERSITVHPGSDFQLFTRDDIDNVEDDCIGMVYRLEPDKLNEDSITPFIKVVQRRPETRVIIVGGGTYLASYQEACKKAGVLDTFTFTGYVNYDDLPKWYRKFSLFVAPVWKESFGQVSPFAMSMGIPVVGYNIGALYEIIGKDELLATPCDSDKLANIIIELLDDRERRLLIGRYNQNRAQELFSVESMTNTYRQIYTELLGLK